MNMVVITPSSSKDHITCNCMLISHTSCLNGYISSPRGAVETMGGSRSTPNGELDVSTRSVGSLTCCHFYSTAAIVAHKRVASA